MKKMVYRPFYRHAPIRDIESLCCTLQIDRSNLIRICCEAGSRYRPVVVTKKGKKRQTWDAHNELKTVQALIQCKLLKAVDMPNYLHGSLPKRDASSNAGQHVGAAIVINEDIKDFFPSISAEKVYRIWSELFRFGPEVSYALTLLTTKDGYVPQGAKTSSYLANLAFFREEPDLVGFLARKGISYTRYVDDVSISSRRFVPRSEQARLISIIYRTLGMAGFEAKRSKHRVDTSGQSMMVTGLLVNAKTSLPLDDRSAIRAQVENLAEEAVLAQFTGKYRKKYNQASGKVAAMQRHHPNQGKQLREKLKSITPKKRTSSKAYNSANATDSSKSDSSVG